MVISERRRFTYTAIAITLAGIITGLLLGSAVISGAPPTKTFNVIPYHWGYALFDEDWNEIEQMVVQRGTTVRLIAYPVTLFPPEIVEKLHQRVVAKGLKTKKGEEVTEYPPGDPRILEVINKAHMDPETMNHGVFIEQFDIDLGPKGDKSLLEGAIASVVFTPDALGVYEMKCSVECGPGHEFFALANALVVK